MILSKEDRMKFIAYLESQIGDARMLKQQAETIPGMAVVTKRFELEIQVYGFMLNKLQNIEEVVIGKKEPSDDRA